METRNWYARTSGHRGCRGTPSSCTRPRRRRMRCVMGPASAKSAGANAMSHGTSHSKTCDGVRSSSQPPAYPPRIDGMLPQTTQGPSPCSSRRKPYSAAMDPGDSETVLVALARIGGRPSQTSSGKVISEPPPAMALTAPATVAAAKRTMPSVGSRSIHAGAELRVVPARHALGPHPDHAAFARLSAEHVAQTLHLTRVVLVLHGLEDVEHPFGVVVDLGAAADDETLQLGIGAPALEQQRAARVAP